MEAFLFFVLFAIVGVGLFLMMMQLVSFYTSFLVKKDQSLLEKTTENDSRRSRKTELQNLIDSLKNEDLVLDARIEQRTEFIAELENNVSSLRDQALLTDLKEDIRTLKNSYDLKNKELHKQNDSIKQLEKSIKNLAEDFNEEKAAREVSLKQEMYDLRQNKLEQIGQDIADFEDLRLQDTNMAVAKAKTSAVESLIEWWDKELEKNEERLSNDYKIIHKQAIVKAEEEAAYLIHEASTDLYKLSQS